MDLNTQKEEFSYGYLQLLCALNGLEFLKTGRPTDNIGIDAMIVGTKKIYQVDAPRIDLQVKCTSQDFKKANAIKFPLAVKTYNELRNEFSYSKKILIVVIVPKNLEEWVLLEDDKMILMVSSYWICLEGYPETQNKENITIDIPKTNIITKITLLDLLEQESKIRYQMIQKVKSKNNVQS